MHRVHGNAWSGEVECRIMEYKCTKVEIFLLEFRGVEDVAYGMCSTCVYRMHASLKPLSPCATAEKWKEAEKRR